MSELPSEKRDSLSVDMLAVWAPFFIVFFIVFIVIGTGFWIGFFLMVICILLFIDLKDKFKFTSTILPQSFSSYYDQKISPLRKYGKKFYIIAFSVLVLLFSLNKITSSQMYHQYRFNNAIIALAEDKNFDALNDTLNNLDKVTRQSDIIYTIDWFLSSKAPVEKLNVIEQCIINNQNTKLSDSILSLYTKHGIKEFLDNNAIVSCFIKTENEVLLNSLLDKLKKFNLLKLKPVFVNKLSELPENAALQSKWVIFLGSVDRDYFIQAFLTYYKKYINNVITGETEFSSANKSVTPLPYLKLSSQPIIDSISYCFEKVISNSSEINSLNSSLPEKPTYSGPEKPIIPKFVRWMRYINYSGAGVLAVDDDRQFFVIMNGFKKVDLYYEGYVLEAGSTQTITFNTGAQVDAYLVYEFSEKETNKLLSEYQQKVKDAKIFYAGRMQEYNEKFAEVQNENAKKAELSRSNTTLINTVKELLSKI